MVAPGSNPRVNTGLIRRTLQPVRAGHGNAEGSDEANSSGPVETQRSAGLKACSEAGGHSEHHNDAKTPRIPLRANRASASWDEGIVRTGSKDSGYPSPHLHHSRPLGGLPRGLLVIDIPSCLGVGCETMLYKQAKRLNVEDAAYLAGMVDGEGTITLSRRSRHKQRGLVLTISNTEKPILDYVLDTVGVGKITNKRIARSHHTPSYTYQVSNRQALSLLGQITPFLRSHKAARSALVLKDYLRLTPRNGRYTKELLKERDAFIGMFFSIRPGAQPADRNSRTIGHEYSLTGQRVLAPNAMHSRICQCACPTFLS